MRNDENGQLVAVCQECKKYYPIDYPFRYVMGFDRCKDHNKKL